MSVLKFFRIRKLFVLVGVKVSFVGVGGSAENRHCLCLYLLLSILLTLGLSQTSCYCRAKLARL